MGRQSAIGRTGHTLSPGQLSTRSTPILFSRQRQLLELLVALGGIVNKLDFQKLLFLFCQELTTRDAPYEFVPYKYGAFSFTSYADRRKLIERGLLADDEHNWRITDEGRRVVGSTPNMHLAAFSSRHRNLRGDDLIADTYRRFPFYAIRSEIATRVLKDDGPALSRIATVGAKPTGPALITIGYEGHTLESYLNRLLKSGVTLLCDVRRNPISRKYGFSKSTLARSCAGVNIRYEHLPELGIASEKRQRLVTQDDYNALFAVYAQTTIPRQGQTLRKIRGWIVDGERVALTCYEHLSQQCHRHCVAEALERQYGDTFIPKHL